MINPPPPPPAKESSRLRRWIIVSCLIAPLICCGGPILFSRRWVDSVDNSADLDRLVVKAKEHHLPFETKDFIDSKAVPDAENSYPLIAKLMKEFPDASKLRKIINDYTPRKGGHVPKEMAAFLERTKVIAKFSRFDAHKDYDLGGNILFPEFSYFREMAHALGMQAQQDALNGDIASAMQNLGRIRMLANQLTHEKVMIGCLVNITINMRYLLTTAKLIAFWEKNPEALNQIRAVLQSKMPMTDLPGVIQGEFFYGVTFLRNFELFGGTKAMALDSVYHEIDATKLKRSGLPEGIVQRGMLASLIDHTVKIQSIFESTPNKVEACKQADLFMAKVPTTVSNSYSLISQTIWGPAGVAMERPNLVRQMQIQGIDVLLRRKGGEFPGTIPDIADPVAGGTVMYKRTGSGFIIYSLGKNKKDDGGPKNNIDRKESDDFGFEFSIQ